MTALGRTKAPVDNSKVSRVEGEDGLLAKTTFAKWVGTDTLGGEPITSWVYQDESSRSRLKIIAVSAYHSPFAISFLSR